MIPQDFNIRHPSLSNHLYKKWSKVSKILFQYCSTMKDFSASRVLGISKSTEEWTDDEYAIVGMLLLPVIFIQSGRRNKGSELKRLEPASKRRKCSESVRNKLGRTGRVSLQVQKDFLVSFVTENANLVELIGSGTPSYPRIVIRGNLSDLDLIQTFVVLQDVIIPCENSFLSAIDTCFKSFVVLGIDFPPETRACWQFLAFGVFEKSYSLSEAVCPAVRALIGQIFPRL